MRRKRPGVLFGFRSQKPVGVAGRVAAMAKSENNMLLQGMKGRQCFMNTVQ